MVKANIACYYSRVDKMTCYPIVMDEVSQMQFKETITNCKRFSVDFKNAKPSGRK